MKSAVNVARSGAFTVIGLIVIGFAVVMLAVLIFFGMAKAKEQSLQKTCANNLDLINIAFQLRPWDTYPMAMSTNQGGTMEFIETGDVFRHFQFFSNELQTPKNLICPTDIRRPALNFQTISNTNISYFVNIDIADTYPCNMLSGDRSVTNSSVLQNGLLTIVTNQPVGWDQGLHKQRGHVLFTDMHAQFTSSPQLREALIKTGVATNRFAIP